MMSSSPSMRRPTLSTLGTQSTLTARKAGCEIEETAESSSCVLEGLQSSSFQKASGSRAQSPLGQNRGGSVTGGGGTIDPGAIAAGSPSAISADSAWSALGSSSPMPHPT